MSSDSLDVDGLAPKLIKGLASSHNSIRSKSLQTLISWLPSQTLISDDQMKKLWKTLFYCMWHSDKIQNQTNLINRLSSLLPSLNPDVGLCYFSVFLLTMRREWPGIDHLRLDKFYLLVRFFVRNLFITLQNRKWVLKDVEGFVGVLEKRVFFVEDGKEDKGLGNGVSYHVVAVFCEELKPFLPLGVEVLEVLFRPFVRVMGESENKVLVGKVRSCVFEGLVKNGKGLLEVKKSESGEEMDEKDERVLFGSVALGMGFAARFFELGSREECVQGNRKVLFGLHEEFLKLEKEKPSLGIEISFPKGSSDDGGDEEEVPQLIPINGGDDMEEDTKVGSSKKKGDKKSKKKKKKKNANVGSGSNSDTEMANSNDDASSNPELDEEMNALELDQAVISNLQKQFEKIAAESGLEGDGASAIEFESPPTVKLSGKAKKRKRSKSVVNGEPSLKETVGEEDEEAVPKTEGKSVKRVRFSMKNNLVWKPQTPLPPQSLRIPPSVTPRGSALKKGVCPGPIRDTSQEVKKAKKKKASPLKKARKVKSISPSAKRAKKKANLLMSA